MYSKRRLHRLNTSRLRTSVCLVATIATMAGVIQGQSASAQNAVPSVPDASYKISMVYCKAPIKDVLELLYKSEGMNPDLVPDLQGTVTVDINAVTFDTALHALLRSANPPVNVDQLTFGGRQSEPVWLSNQQAQDKTAAAHSWYKVSDREEGTMVHINVYSGSAPIVKLDRTRESLYVIPIKHYDPGMIANILLDNSSVVNVPPNFVVVQSGATVGRSTNSNTNGANFIGGSTPNFVISL